MTDTVVNFWTRLEPNTKLEGLGRLLFDTKHEYNTTQPHKK